MSDGQAHIRRVRQAKKDGREEQKPSSEKKEKERKAQENKRKGKRGYCWSGLRCRMNKNKRVGNRGI
ncbi:hypothetical protein K457DRAFT_142941 [Linnemannia elongata AG-77]|uniref:Uncharacterized protein n=1 Tax=Linnemannia elongata AG-77 TaxID=1314771 RepID=A0A197JDJ2_9FUNG|nr:hypothetical protein K457DRAFT_142941 [Linnemannia elongata AG-77]